MFRRPVWNVTRASCVLAMVLITAGCNADELLNSSVISWELIDECDDGLGIAVRFFDEDTGQIWPSDTTVWILPSGESAIYTPDCSRDHVICFGAIQDSPEPAAAWGVGIDGTMECGDCCVVCGDGDFPTDELRCP